MPEWVGGDVHGPLPGDGSQFDLDEAARRRAARAGSGPGLHAAPPPPAPADLPPAAGGTLAPLLALLAVIMSTVAPILKALRRQR